MIPTLDRAQVSNRAAGLCTQVDGAMLRIQQFKLWLDTVSDQTLINLGFVQADVDTLRSAVSDLEQLRTIYDGAATLAVAKDFRTFTKQVYAFGSI